MTTQSKIAPVLESKIPNPKSKIAPAPESKIPNPKSKIALRCVQTLPSGRLCFHDALTCPYHDPPGQQLDSPQQGAESGPLDSPPATIPSPLDGPLRSGLKMPAFVERRDNALDPRKLAADVLKSAANGSASPLQVGRIIRATRALSAMGEPPADEDTALAEAQFRGRLLHGLPPQTEEEWNYCRRVFTKDAVAEFARWAVLLDAPYPADIEPVGGRTYQEAQSVTATAAERKREAESAPTTTDTS